MTVIEERFSTTSSYSRRGEKEEKKKEKEKKTELTGLEHPHHSQSR